MRLDLYLVSNKLADTRSKAAQLIKNGKVLVNGKVILKNGFEFKEPDKVEIIENDVLEFVSRGGHKLEKAINVFGLDFKDKVICDIGSSTGGFTDCSLKHGAKKVYAIDVGTNQLHDSLKEDTRVVVLENTNFRYVDKSIFKDKIDFYVCDVSFISIRLILETLLSFNEDFKIIILFKPQFEVGKDKLNHNGVVRKDAFLVEALNSFSSFLKEKHIHVLDASYSPIKGNKEGNIEFLFYLSTNGTDKHINYSELVKQAVLELKK